MLAGRDVVGKEGLRTIRTKTFRGLKGREPLRTGRMRMWSIFLPPCFYCRHLAYRSSPFRGGSTVTALTSRVVMARTYGNEHGPDP